MEITCILNDKNNSENNKNNNRRVCVSNDVGYNSVNIQIQSFQNNQWIDIGNIRLDGQSMIKAINNAMND